MKIKNATIKDFNTAYEYIKKLWDYNTYDYETTKEVYEKVLQDENSFAFFAIEDDGTFNGFCHGDYFPVFSNVMELLKTLDKIAEAHNVPVAQVFINWSTQKSFVGTALTGVNTPAQADENCSAFEWQLNNEEIALIDSEIDRLNIG